MADNLFTQIADALKGYVDCVIDTATEDIGDNATAVREFLHGKDPATDTIVMPAYVRGIGMCYITTSEGQDLVEGTFNFPSVVQAGATTIFTASNGVSTVEYKTVTTATRYFSYNARSYFYSPSLNAQGERIRPFWNGTDADREINGIYILTNNYPAAYPGNITSAPQYPFRLKYFTLNTYKYETVNNNNGVNVPTQYNTTWNINIPVGGDTITFNDYRSTVINQYNTYIISQDPTAETLNPQDPGEEYDWDNVIDYIYPEPTEPTEPIEPTEPDIGTGGIVINNYDTLNVDADFNGTADIDINGSVNVGAGAFGAGAFGAGAFGTVDIDVNANAFGAGSADFVLNVDGSLNIPELNLSGNTITHNNYDGAQITQNVYTIQVESGASLELPSYPAIDYNEILSPSELAEVLEGDETYYIEPVETGLYALELQTLPPMEALPEQLTLVSGAVMSEGVDILDDFGLSPVYSSLAVFMIVCFILRGGR